MALPGLLPDSARAVPRRILAIEDESDILALILAGCAAGGLRARGCSGGQEGLDIARRWHPDLILLDMRMPPPDGVATFEALKQQADTAWIPVIFLTTAVDVKKLSALLARGALGVIQKPFSPMRLSFEIRQLWNRREGLRRPAGFLPEIPS